jgi:hypothetical protein
MRLYVYDLGIGSRRSRSAGLAAVMWAVMRRCGADILFFLSIVRLDCSINNVSIELLG